MNKATLWSHQMQLPAEVQSVLRARHFVCTLLIEHRFLNLVEDVRLVVSELATNAVRHAHTPFTVTLERLDEWGQRSRRSSLSAEIQQRLLPGPRTCEAGAFTLSAWLEPAAEIAGDTFDYSLARGPAAPVDDRRVRI